MGIEDKVSGRRSGLLLALGLLALLLFPHGVQAQDRPKWWDKGASWKYRTLLSAPPGAGAYKAWVYTGRRATATGGDIWLVSPGEKVVPFSIVYSSNEGRHLIIFKEQKGEPKGFYALYYGNPGATPMARGFPEAGLVLKTRPVPEGADVDSWKGAEATMRKAVTWGGDLWPQVFDAFNPFGAQSDYISSYEGYVDCPKEGMYKFATMSDDASFLLIDNEVVAQWPGRKPRDINNSRHGQMSGQKQLKAGLHAFQYVGFAFGGPKRMAAAWQLPDKDRFEVIPASAFPTVTAARPVLCEEQGRSVCAGFGAEPVAYLESDDGRIKMIAVQFTSLSSAQIGQVKELAWDFGDGQAGTQREPLHVFIGAGKYDVKLTASTPSAATDTFTVKFEARQNWREPDYTFANRLKFWDWIKEYNVAKLPTAALLDLREYLLPGDPQLLLPDPAKAQEQRAKAFDVCVELDKRRSELKPPSLIGPIALFLADYSLEPLKKWQQAEKYLNVALEMLPKDDQDKRFDIRLKIADLYFYYAGDAARAKAAFTALRADLPKADARRRRLALIRMADIERDQGQLDEARKLYAEAEGDLSFIPKEPRAVADGRYSLEIEANLLQGNGDVALAKVEEWLWSYPTKRLDGLPMVLRLKANMLLKNYQEVNKQADIYTRFSQDPEYLPQVHALAGQACEGQGKKDEARKHYQAVLDNWPEASVSKEAKTALGKLK